MDLNVCYPTIYEPSVYGPSSSKKRARDSNKRDLKARELLFGLIDLYINQAKPIGSETLKSNSFAHLSSATIRNYFSTLEAQGYLIQAHTSGGRIPSDRAWREYYDHHSQQPIHSSLLQELEESFGKEIASMSHPLKHKIGLFDSLRTLCEKFSKWSRTACFMLSPKPGNDTITHVKIWPFQVDRWLVVTRSQMGNFEHELIAGNSETDLSSKPPPRLALLEKALLEKIREPLFETSSLTDTENKLLKEVYQELILRQLMRHGTKERLWQTFGLSQLLSYSELSHADQLAGALHFFEHRRSKDKLINTLQEHPYPGSWIGSELSRLHSPCSECTLLACPIFIHQQVVGLIGLLGPKRIPIIKLKQSLEYISRLISAHFTREYYTYKLSVDAPFQPYTDPTKGPTL